MKLEDLLKRGVLGEEDRRLVEIQLGRPLRGEVRVASRCPHGKVEVIATSPVLDDGTPFPTLFWLTCPFLQREVSRLESGNLREELRRRLDAEEGFASGLREGEAEYRRLREEWAERLGSGERVRELFSSRAGIGGTVAGGLKCLHAHLAHALAGGRNPVGEMLREEVGDIQVRGCRGDCEAFTGRKR